MSDIAIKLFEGLRTVKDGLQEGLGEAMGQAGAEMNRLGVQGTMELASALFNGRGFVPYGPGQYTPTVEQHQQQQIDRGMER